MENQISLSQVYNRRRTDRDIFQELMPFKTREVLLVATYYDAYSIIREDRFFEKIFGEYLQLNLFSAPRITSASNWAEVEDCMEAREYDMVIIMAGVDKEMPINISRRIKQKKPLLPILLLANNNSDLKFFDEASGKLKAIDRVFVWNGDSRVFLAMIKYIEDKMNVEVDVRVGDVRVILLVEDSQKYYTRYLPLLYSIILRQTQTILAEESIDQIHKIMKMRVRPKILLVSNYEEAVEIVDRYLDNLLCVISDVKFNRNGRQEDNAGIELISYVRSRIGIPVLLQSSDPANAAKAEAIHADFIDKNSDGLSLDIYNFIHTKLGFGNFLFTNSRGAHIDVAHNLKEFEECIRDIPAESLLYHGKRNGLSAWLMARGEISLAKKLRPYRIEDFESTHKLRQKILDVFEENRFERLRGRVVMFDPQLTRSDRFIMRMGEGSFGGKGRGLAFLCNFIENVEFEKFLPEIKISIPPTTVIGAEEFAHFIESNNLFQQIYFEKDYEAIKSRFLEASLPESLIQQLRSYIEHYQVPLAVRSSGLFEDSLLQPFAGVYATFILPNNHPDPEVRLKQLRDAIKLVYASIFSDQARAYFEAVNYKIEEEKMAVIIQHLVGERANGKFYPHISGVAQSYNYYPFSYMKPEDGFAVLCVGLGKYVVGGEKAWRFSPRHAKLQLNSIADQVKDSQQHFYALDLDKSLADPVANGEDAAVLKLPIREAEEDGNLRHCASVYDYNYDQVVSDFTQKGPRIVNFSNILQYDHIPLAKAIDILLQSFTEAMGAPVEIEFAVDLDSGGEGKPTLYLLQIKPLIRIENHADIHIGELDQSKVWLQSAKGMGNGRLEYIRDVVFVNVEHFDRTKTIEMAKEMDQLNTWFEEYNREYVLIGPGRWGTRDRFTGIPVYWSQISKVRVIVEMGLEDFPLEASLGSHFFHNVTSMNVGYFSVHRNSATEWINMDFLRSQKVVQQSHFFTHIQFDYPCPVWMDGKNQRAFILQPEPPSDNEAIIS